MHSSSMGMREPERIFGNTFQALFCIALHGQLSERCIDRLAGVGLNLRRPLESTYGLQVWIEALEIVRAEVFPNLSADDAYFRLGTLCIEGIKETSVGRAVHAIAKLIGPARMLDRMERNLRISDNFMHARTEQRSAGRATLWIHPVHEPSTFYAGLLDALVRFSAGKDVVVTFEAEEPSRIRYDVRWRA